MPEKRVRPVTAAVKPEMIPRSRGCGRSSARADLFDHVARHLEDEIADIISSAKTNTADEKPSPVHRQPARADIDPVEIGEEVAEVSIVYSASPAPSFLLQCRDLVRDSRLRHVSSRVSTLAEYRRRAARCRARYRSIHAQRGQPGGDSTPTRRRRSPARQGASSSNRFSTGESAPADRPRRSARREDSSEPSRKCPRD